MAELGKITTSGRAKRTVAKAAKSANKQIKKATTRILKTYKKRAGKAIDSAVKSTRKKATPRRKCTNKK